MRDNDAIRINLAAPVRGKHLAGRPVSLRGERGGRRFILGLLVGLLFWTIVVISALALGGRGPVAPAESPWAAAMARESASLPVDVAEPLRQLAALAVAIDSFERAATPPAPGWSRLLRGKSKSDESAERAAQVLARDARRRAGQYLDEWDGRGGDLAGLAIDERTAAIRVLGMARWLVHGGELAVSLQHYEELIAVAVTARIAAEAAVAAEATPQPSPRRK